MVSFSLRLFACSLGCCLTFDDLAQFTTFQKRRIWNPLFVLESFDLIHPKHTKLREQQYRQREVSIQPRICSCLMIWLLARNFYFLCKKKPKLGGVLTLFGSSERTKDIVNMWVILAENPRFANKNSWKWAEVLCVCVDGLNIESQGAVSLGYISAWNLSANWVDWA